MHAQEQQQPVGEQEMASAEAADAEEAADGRQEAEPTIEAPDEDPAQLEAEGTEAAEEQQQVPGLEPDAANDTKVGSLHALPQRHSLMLACSHVHPLGWPA